MLKEKAISLIGKGTSQLNGINVDIKTSKSEDQCLIINVLPLNPYTTNASLNLWMNQASDAKWNAFFG